MVCTMSYRFKWVDMINFGLCCCLGHVRGVNVNKRTVTTHPCCLLQEIRFDHNMSLFSFSFTGHTWPKLIFAI